MRRVWLVAWLFWALKVTTLNGYPAAQWYEVGYGANWTVAQCQAAQARTANSTPCFEMP